MQRNGAERERVDRMHNSNCNELYRGVCLWKRGAHVKIEMCKCEQCETMVDYVEWICKLEWINISLDYNKDYICIWEMTVIFVREEYDGYCDCIWIFWTLSYLSDDETEILHIEIGRLYENVCKHERLTILSKHCTAQHIKKSGHTNP